MFHSNFRNIGDFMTLGLYFLTHKAEKLVKSSSNQGNHLPALILQQQICVFFSSEKKTIKKQPPNPQAPKKSIPVAPNGRSYRSFTTGCPCHFIKGPMLVRFTPCRVMAIICLKVFLHSKGRDFEEKKT